MKKAALPHNELKRLEEIDETTDDAAGEVGEACLMFHTEQLQEKLSNLIKISEIKIEIDWHWDINSELVKTMNF